MFVPKNECGGFDIAGFVIVEADGVDEFVESFRGDVQDVFKRETWRG